MKFDSNQDKLNDFKDAKLIITTKIKMEAINIICINEIVNNPIVDIIMKDSEINVKVYQGGIKMNAKFRNLSVYDLTNYPYTLITQDLSKIKP